MTKKTQKSEKQEETQKKRVIGTPEEPIDVEASQPADKEGEVEEQAEAPVNFEEKLAELQDRYLRLSAEFDNYRKRTVKEKMDLLTFSREEVFIKILPVVDDFERAMESIGSARDLEAVKEGLNLIYLKFKNYLSQEGVKVIEAKDKPFDTDLHEAVTKIVVEEKKKKGKVVDEIEKGYMLKDKVIRYSKVVIGE